MRDAKMVMINSNTISNTFLGEKFKPHTSYMMYQELTM